MNDEDVKLCYEWARLVYPFLPLGWSVTSTVTPKAGEDFGITLTERRSLGGGHYATLKLSVPVTELRAADKEHAVKQVLDWRACLEQARIGVGR